MTDLCQVAHRVLMVLLSQDLNAPSEGGWAWMIALSGFMMNALTFGAIRSMGVFFVEFVHLFNKLSSEVSWIASISIAVLQFASFGWALVYTPTMSTIPKYFVRRRGLALGLVLTGNGLSSILFSPLFQVLIDIYSWRGALVIISAIVLNLCISGALLRPIRMLQDHRHGQAQAENHSKCALFLRKLTSDLDLSLFRNRGFVMFQAGNLLICTGTFVVYVHLVSHGKTLGLSSYEAAFLMSATGLADTCSRPLSGWFADLKLLTPLQLLVLWSSTTGLSLLLLPLGKTFPGIMALGVTYGLNIGAFAPMFFAVLPDLVTVERMTSAVGLSMMVVAFGALLGPPFSGFLRDLTGGYTVSFLVFGGLTLAGAGIMMCIPSFFTGTSLPFRMKKSSNLPHTEDKPSVSSTLMRLSSVDQSLDTSMNI
ncbi:hypothetical protein NDU88_000457 [Pleurodeles waltl]|uniref:Major facilitator superfamily (MFS) profile domain-containing protein n=1 Tax=Pleurodeles waltl TaxID=8319 RepID=A0AAV7KTI3_PLEWA|nr:hypothetical protein NDU88_000457 [Pleurodeles waltl]